MEPSFWSWEKQHKVSYNDLPHKGRNGAQLLELGKANPQPCPQCRHPGRNGAQLLELGKVVSVDR